MAVAVAGRLERGELLRGLITRLLLEGGKLDGVGDASPFEGRHGPRTSTALVPMEAHPAAAADAPLDEVIAVARLFQWRLPGRVTHVAHLRAQLA